MRPVITLLSLLSMAASALAAQRADSAPSPQATPMTSRSDVVVTLPDPDFHPEGVAWDPRTRRLFVGSVHRGVVVVVDSNGAVRPFVAAGTSGLRAVFGVLADTARNLLWVSSSDVREREGGVATPRAPAAIFAFALDDGRLIRRWTFPDGTSHHLIGELVLSPDGTVWGTDSEQPALYRVPTDPSRTVLEKSALTHARWRSLQGLAFGADAREAWLADWSTGLYHVDFMAGVVTPVTTPPEETLRGIDGLYRVGAGHFLAIQNGRAPFRLVALDLDARGTELRRLRVVDHPPGEGEPTLGVVTDTGLLFVAGSLWPFYDASGRLRPHPGQTLGEIRRIPWR